MLTDITINPGYTTPIDDVGRDFYTPALMNSVRYDRISGYFSAKALSYFSKGIEGPDTVSAFGFAFCRGLSEILQIQTHLFFSPCV